MNEEQQKMATLLQGVAVPPSRVTVEAAVQSGRRGERRRRHITISAAAASLVVVTFAAVGLLGRDVPGKIVVGPSSTPSTSPSPKPMWTATELTNPTGSKHARASAVDPTGRYVVGGADGKLVLWDNGSPTVLPPPEEGLVESIESAVNSSGHIVGRASRHDDTQYGWLYRDGGYTKLAAPKGDSQYVANSINARGDVLGWSMKSGVLLWQASEQGKVKQVSGLDSASGLGDDGTIGGEVGDGDHPGIVDPAGKSHRVAELAGRPGGKIFAVSGDWAAGWVPADSDSNLMAARWNLRTGELTSYPNLTSPVNMVSATGAFVTSRKNLHPPVFVTPAGEVIDLPPLNGTDLDPPATRRPNRLQLLATGISADATVIVGYQVVGSQTTVAVIWRH